MANGGNLTHRSLEDLLAQDPDLATWLERAFGLRDSLAENDRGPKTITDLAKSSLIPFLRGSREFGRDAFPLAYGTLLDMLANAGLDPERVASRGREVSRGAEGAIQQSQAAAARSGIRAPALAATEGAIRADASNRRLGISLEEENAAFGRKSQLLSMFKDLFLNPAQFGLAQDRSLEIARGGQGDRALQAYGTLIGSVAPMFLGPAGTAATVATTPKDDEWNDPYGGGLGPFM